jgi:hypothetical protein
MEILPKRGCSGGGGFMKVWIDVTDLLAWNGHLTGIQRVVFNIASRMQRDNSDKVRFFYYDSYARTFHTKEIILEEWLSFNSEKTKVNHISLKYKIMTKVPYGIRKRTPQSVKKLVLKSGKFVIDKKNKFGSRSSSVINKDPLATFEDGDKVMVLGNGWDNQNIIFDLGLLKLKVKFKLVNVVYDLIPIFEPQYFGGLVTAQYANYMFEAVKNCDLLLPISKSTESDIFRFCELIDSSNPKTSVIRLGDEISKSENTKKPDWIKNTDFVLCVGTIEIRKNHTLIYYAYKNLISSGVKPPNLIIVGKRGWYTGDVVMLFEQDPEMKKYIHLAENVSDEELVWLYENCRFTIYPSLYEGWGLPVAESLARGKVVLCSNSSSVPEAGGQLAEYFSPYDPVGFSELISKYSNDKIRYSKELEIERGYTITTWEDCYNQVIKYLK